MVSLECFVQEGCVPAGLRVRLESAIQETCFAQFGRGAGKLATQWTVIARGCGFRGGKPSTTSLVRARIPDGCGRETRAAFLRSVGDRWCQITRARPDEVIVSARDWSWEG